MTAAETHRAITEVFRRESARLIAALTRMVRDLDLAEELAQDALLAALEQWPSEGLPDNPGAWLMGVAKHRGLNAMRRRRMLERKHEELGRDLASSDEGAADLDAMIDDDIGDDLLRLVFVSCHPLLGAEARVALTLRLLGGLTTEEIARAFLVPEATIAQRIVRAKRTLAEARVPFEVPRGPDLSERLAAVLGVVYLVFNEGYSATAGDDWMRPRLCDEALRLVRLLAEIAPGEPEVHGLLALMELNASRAAAHRRQRRTGAAARSGPRPLGRRRHRARPGGAGARRALGGGAGPYALQAAVIACHARARAAPTPTGRGSPRCTRRWRGARHRRWWRSTGRWRCPWPRARLPGWPSSMRSGKSRRWPVTTCCRACAATCSSSSAASTRRAPSSRARRR
ncbi:MAG: sigma-70 family RNA polymerase sigma factor [Polyangiaceae bacterium]